MRGLDARQGPTPFCGDGDGMETVKLVVSYDGTDFHGFARQRGLRTVQGVLEDTLSQILKRPTEVFGSGRTDKGVHARAQVIHFSQPYGPPADRYPFVLRRALPRDIVPLVAEAVSDSFHARFSAIGKTYRYTLHTAPLEDVFTTRFVWHLPVTLNWDAMSEAAAHLVGTHDFTSFCAASTPIEDKSVRFTASHFSRAASIRISSLAVTAFCSIWCASLSALWLMLARGGSPRIRWVVF